MRAINLALVVIFLASTFTFAQRGPKFVQPKKNGVGIYQNETRSVNETATLTVGVNDRLKVLKTTRGHYKVKTDDGSTGWVEKRLVAAASGKSFHKVDPP